MDVGRPPRGRGRDVPFFLYFPSLPPSPQPPLLFFFMCTLLGCYKGPPSATIQHIARFCTISVIYTSFYHKSKCSREKDVIALVAFLCIATPGYSKHCEYYYIFIYFNTLKAQGHYRGGGHTILIQQKIQTNKATWL